MSRKDKLLNKLCVIPAPKDIKWNDFITLMNHCGFENTCNGGSHYTFEHTSGFRFTMSKTHPSGVLKTYQVRAAKTALSHIGAII